MHLTSSDIDQDKEYLIIGPHLLLVGIGDGSYRPGFSMKVWHRDEVVGTICTVSKSPQEVQLEFKNTSLSPALKVEAYRLFARVVTRLTNFIVDVGFEFAGLKAEFAQLLSADGFHLKDDKQWLRSGGKFVRRAAERAPDMQSLYEDPFTIPWNFVPIEKDLLKYFLAEARAKSKVLELGCGYGKNSLYLQRKDFDMWGIDISEPAIIRCRELLKSQQQFMPASADQLPDDFHSFDYILDIGCLHCMPVQSRRRAISRLKQVLQPNGLFFSRIFKPRSPKWVAEQPFVVDQFGLSIDEVRALFASSELHFSILEDAAHATYIKAWK